jgi:drug/metabolite transporter (DMT)-like permease
MLQAEYFIEAIAELCNMATKAISPFNIFLMLALITFWGSSFVVVKLILREGLTPVEIATFRFLIAGGLFLAALLLKKSMNREYRLRVGGRDVLALLILALAGVTFFFTIQYTGIEMAGASIAAILVCLLSPILITVFSARIFKEHLTKKQVFGIGIAAAGTFTVVGGSPSFQGNTEFFLGSLLLLSTPFLWATYTLLGKKIMQKYDAFLIVAYVTMLGGLCLVPFSLAENSFYQIFSINLHEWLAILYLSFTCSLVGYYIWFYVLKKVDAAVTSSFLFVEPLITGVFAVMFVGETLNLFILAGGLLIFAGLYLVTKR